MTSFAVLMPNYNHGRYLNEALDAVLSQKGTDGRLVLVDDGSTDDSTSRVQAYIDRHGQQFDYIQLPSNKGVIHAMEAVLATTSEPLFFSIGPDDPVKLGFFTHSLDMMKCYPKAGLCFSDTTRLFPSGETREVTHHLSDRPCYLTPHAFARKIDEQPRFSIATSSCCWRRQPFLDIWDHRLRELRWHYDWFVSLVVAFRHGVCYIPEAYQFVRIDPASYSLAGIHSEAQSEVYVTLLELLQDPAYADVKPFFKIPSILSKFGIEIVNLIEEHPIYHDYLSDRLIELAHQADEYNHERQRQFEYAFKSTE
ncbi:MAG: glycosyltransferase [Candidatus Sedimenticola sp. (ex Thyasira tokunagai)]